MQRTRRPKSSGRHGDHTMQLGLPESIVKVNKEIAAKALHDTVAATQREEHANRDAEAAAA